MQLTYKHLRGGSITLLARLTGFSSVQLSMWFNTPRQPNRRNVQRLSKAVGITEAEVLRAIDERRAEVLRARNINKAIQQAIVERQRASAKPASTAICI